MSTQLIDQAAVAAAMIEIEEADKEYPSVPKIRRKLKEMIGKSGQQNQVHELQKAVFADRKAARSADQQPATLESIPDSIDAMLNTAHDALKKGVAKVLHEKSTEMNRRTDLLIAKYSAESDQRVIAADIETRATMDENDHLEKELEEATCKVADITVGLFAAREQLAAVNERATGLMEKYDAVKKVAADERARADKEMAVARDAKAEIATALADTAKLGAELDAAKKENGRLVMGLEQLSGTNAALTAALESIRIDLAGEKARADQIAADRDAAKMEVIVERKRGDEAVADNAMFKAEKALQEKSKSASRKEVIP
jgi:chromosome segregation ATPase